MTRSSLFLKMVPALVLLAALPAACRVQNTSGEFSRMKEDLEKISRKADAVSLRGKDLIDSGEVTPASVKNLAVAFHIAILQYHDGLARVDLDLLLQHPQGRFLYEKFLLQYESAVKDFRLFLSQCRQPLGAEVDGDGFFLCEGFLAEVSDKFDEDQAEMARRLETSGSSTESAGPSD